MGSMKPAAEIVENARQAGLAIPEAAGAGIFLSPATGLKTGFEGGVAAMVRGKRRFEPDAQQGRLYTTWFERYRRLWPLMREYLGGRRPRRSK